MKNRQKYSIIAISVILVIGVVFMFNRFGGATRIATLNFPDFTVEKLIRSNNNRFIKIESVDLADAPRIRKYDMVLVRVHGSSLDKSHLEAIRTAIERGVTVFSTESDNEKINSLTGRELEYISTLMENGSVKNYSSMLNYVRARIDNKKWFNKSYDEPAVIPEDYFFHLGEDQFFASYTDYQKFYEESGKYGPNAPRVVFLAGNINIQNSNEEHIAAIIKSLEERGINVYPIYSFGMKKLDMISDVSPDLIIYNPHGRLVMGGGESGTEMLKKLNVPVLAPITISEPYNKWINDKQGMESGSMSSMSVVLPELDGAIAPYAVAAQFERNGLQIFDAIPEQSNKFVDLATNYLSIQKKNNAEKKIAVYYYKNTGKGAVNAADIEGAQSLYNTLKLLADNGYNVNGLPDNPGKLEEMIQKQGAVLGAYALGAYDEFLKSGNPALVNVDTFNTWAGDLLPDKLIEDMIVKYDEAPGDYMSVEKDDQEFIAVARITFGNITILPQPMVTVGENIDEIIHGVDGAPAYPYVASYLWTRKGFGADAIIHFGTHGSLEFIPGKQVALSNYDWSDVLIGDLPHFYIYTINNIGEGIIAKRRSYATLLSHLTAPFMESELYGDMRLLDDRIHRMDIMGEGSIKQNYRESITQLARSQNILSTLSIDTAHILNDEEIKKIHIYLEEIEGSKVIDGLYTLGEPYSEENVNNTVRLMSVDPIRYALARIDAIHGNISDEQLEDPIFIGDRYDAITDKIISLALSGKNTAELLHMAISSEDINLLQEAKTLESARQRMTAEMMMSGINTDDDIIVPKFLDEKGNIIETAVSNKVTGQVDGESMMARMIEAGSMNQESAQNENTTLISSVRQLENAVSRITTIRYNLQQSTGAEQQALLDALNGGYVEPGSAGDPIVNPDAVPTGKNFYSINPETTPSPESWQVGKKLAEELLAAELTIKGKYPEKVSFTLWATDFISSEGATIAQILYLLGVEPLRDGMGYVRSLKLIPAEELGRPRIDVVVQTSGQLRDLAASRLQLINQAVLLAAEDGSESNYVKKGLNDAERYLLEIGFSPADAREYSRERIFGGVNGSYGTGIMGMVEKGDSWDSTGQIARQYIKNMGAIYSANGGNKWAEMREGVFEAALQNTSVVVQPRSSNTWGPLSLDHVYEFMGGMTAAIREVTGNEPTGYFNDFRNTSKAKVQELKEAIGVESGSTLFNPKYIAEMMKGEASSMERFAESFRNTYGWNSMKPDAIDQHIWNQYFDIYVEDKYDLDIKRTFEGKNPYALQEMTAVMLESARKGMWDASDMQIKTLSSLHAELVEKHAAGCSGFICDNTKLREFISSNMESQEADRYEQNIKIAREVQLEQSEINNNVVLRKEQDAKRQENDTQSKTGTGYSLLLITGAVILILGIWLVQKRRRS